LCISSQSCIILHRTTSKSTMTSNNLEIVIQGQLKCYRRVAAISCQLSVVSLSLSRTVYDLQAHLSSKVATFNYTIPSDDPDEGDPLELFG